MVTISRANRRRGSSSNNALDLRVIGLPEALDVNVQGAEEEAAVEAQAPEDCLVVAQPAEGVAGVTEHHIVPVDVVCGWREGT